MLEVKVILHSANTGKSSEIGQLVISQVGVASGGATLRNYSVRASWSEPTVGQEQKRADRFTNGMVYGHDRTQDVWELIRKAIEGLEL